MKKTRPHSWSHKALTEEAQAELRLLGENLRVARERRGLSIAAVSKRLGVNPRVVAKIEKGDPTVTLGGVAQLLSFFGFIVGLAEFAAPEHDLQTTIVEARRHRQGRSAHGPVIDSSEVDF